LANSSITTSRTTATLSALELNQAARSNPSVQTAGITPAVRAVGPLLCPGRTTRLGFDDVDRGAPPLPDAEAYQVPAVLFPGEWRANSSIRLLKMRKADKQLHGIFKESAITKFDGTTITV
jgi:hypothetical protein